MNKNLLGSLIFLLVLVGIFWAMPNQKVDIIGDFFKKLITPISVPLSVIIGTWLGIVKYKKVRKKQEGKSP